MRNLSYNDSKIISFSELTWLTLFLGYKKVFFPFQNTPKNLDLSNKTDLDLWDCLGKVKLVSQQSFIWLI